MSAAAHARHSPRRSTREWVLRGGIAAAAVLLGYVSTAQTLAYALRKSNTERIHSLSPSDGRIAGELAEQIATTDAGPADRARASQVAREALIHEPLSVAAVTALALNRQVTGDTGSARQLFLHADAMSRRSLVTRLWLIEDAVAQGNVAAALRNYDIALRTSRSASKLLFPVLSQAIADPSIAMGLTKLLATAPPWRDGFLTYVGATGTAPEISARFFRQLSGRGIPVPEVARMSVVNALVTAGSFDKGWTYYQSLRPSVDRRQSRDPDFSSGAAISSLFDWAPVTNDAGVSASIDGGMFDFSAPSTVGGVVLQQIQLLPPGRYRLSGISSGIDQPTGSQPYWQLICSDGRELGRVKLVNSSENGGKFDGFVTVDGGCKAQTLRLVVQPTSTIGGVTGRIDRTIIAPAGDDR